MSLDEHLTCLPSERMHRGALGLLQAVLKELVQLTEGKNGNLCPINRGGNKVQCMSVCRGCSLDSEDEEMMKTSLFYA